MNRAGFNLTMVLYIITLICLTFGTLSFSSPLTSIQTISLATRTTPYFPDQPPSCPICQQNYDNINSCAQACPVFENFTMIIFNPGAFINVIKCACTDTFQSVFPQCVDCFEQTNQTDWLSTPDLPGIVNGMRQVCAIASALLGNVSVVDGQVTPTTAAPTPTASTSNGATQLFLACPAPFVVFVTLLTLGLPLFGFE